MCGTSNTPQRQLALIAREEADGGRDIIARVERRIRARAYVEAESKREANAKTDNDYAYSPGCFDLSESRRYLPV